VVPETRHLIGRRATALAALVAFVVYAVVMLWPHLVAALAAAREAYRLQHQAPLTAPTGSILRSAMVGNRASVGVEVSVLAQAVSAA
jgi:hypothetical protein